MLNFHSLLDIYSDNDQGRIIKISIANVKGILQIIKCLY